MTWFCRWTELILHPIDISMHKIVMNHIFPFDGFRTRSLWYICVLYTGKGKGKVIHRTGHEGPKGESRYSYSFFNLVARWGGWSTPCPARFTTGKSRYALSRKLGGPQDRSGRVRKILPPPGFEPQTVQSVASRCTDWAIPAQFAYHIPNIIPFSQDISQQQR